MSFSAKSVLSLLSARSAVTLRAMTFGRPGAVPPVDEDTKRKNEYAYDRQRQVSGLHAVGGEGQRPRPYEGRGGLHEVGSGGNSGREVTAGGDGRRRHPGKDVGMLSPKRTPLKKKYDARAPRHRTAPDILQHPPWVTTRAQFEEKDWLGRKDSPKKKFWLENLAKKANSPASKSWDTWFDHKSRQQTTHSANHYMQVLLEKGEPDHALEVFRKLPEREIQPDSYTYVHAMRACSKKKDVGTALQIFEEMKASGLTNDEGYAYALKVLVDDGQPKR